MEVNAGNLLDFTHLYVKAPHRCSTQPPRQNIINPLTHKDTRLFSSSRVSTGGPGCKYLYFFGEIIIQQTPPLPPKEIIIKVFWSQSFVFFSSCIFGFLVFQGGEAGCICLFLGLISPTVEMLPSPQDSPHIISYALLSLFFLGLLFINSPRPTPYGFFATKITK